MNDSLSVFATFFGVTSLLISDGETHLLTDGFFTRPSLGQVLFTRLHSDPDAIRRGLERAGVERLDAVLVGHSHYDHALDSALVAQLTGATLVGSESTANLGRGAGLAEKQIVVAQPGSPLQFNAFEVTFLSSRHIRPLLAPGEIRQPLRQPAHALAYREGGMSSLFICHPAGSLLVQESAGYIPHALDGYCADAAFLSVGMLGHCRRAYQQAYFEQTAGVLGARVVYPIHHDVFTSLLDGRERPLFTRLLGVPAAIGSLKEWTEKKGVRVGELEPWERWQVLP